MANLEYLSGWEPPATSIPNGLAALREYLEAKSKARQDLRARVAVSNRAMAEAIETEFSKIGIDTKKLEAVGLANIAQSNKEMEKYRQKMNTSMGPVGKDLPIHVARPMNAQSITRMPPYDIADGWLTPTNPSPGFGFVNFDTGGDLLYYLDEPAQAPGPSDVVATTVMGIVLVPMLGNTISILPGIAQIQASMSFFMTGTATSQFWGYGHSEGSVGWIVMELDQNGNFTRVVESTYLEQYYLDSVFGQRQSRNVDNPGFSQSTVFWTFPNRFYEVYIWFWGEIHAAGNQGLHGSQAAGFGDCFVQSISWTWNPWIFF